MKNCRFNAFLLFGVLANCVLPPEVLLSVFQYLPLKTVLESFPNSFPNTAAFTESCAYKIHQKTITHNYISRECVIAFSAAYGELVKLGFLPKLDFRTVNDWRENSLGLKWHVSLEIVEPTEDALQEIIQGIVEKRSLRELALLAVDVPTMQFSNSLHLFTNLETFYYEGRKLSTAEVSAIMDPRNVFSYLTLSCLQIDTDGMEIIANALKGNSKLKKLDIGENDVQNEGLGLLANALSENTSLEELNIQHLEEQRDFSPLWKALHNSNIKTLSLFGNSLTESDIIPFLYTKISSLEIGFNPITEEGWYRIIAALCSGNSKLKRLDISGIRSLKPEHVYALLVARTSLTSLDISDTEMGDHGVLLIFTALTGTNSMITELELSNTGITDVGAQIIARALATGNTKLTSLNIGANEIKPDTVKSIIQAYKDGKTKLRDLFITCRNVYVIIRDGEFESKGPY